MYRTSLAFALTLALSFLAPALAESGEDMEEWDDRTTLEDDNTHTLDSVDAGRTESLDSVERRRNESSFESAPAERLPAIEHGDFEAQAERARERVAQAEERLRQANAAYSEMRARNHPRGEAAEQIVAERQAAERALNDASDYLARIKRAASEAGRPL